jgi:signal transduction histidine kinase
VSSHWEMFPFPTVSVPGGSRLDGSMYAWPDPCLKCRDRPCERSSSDGISTCRYGINFVRVSDDRLVAGVIVSDLATSTTAHKKQRRRNPNSVLRLRTLMSAVSAAQRVSQAAESSFQAERARLLEEYLAEGGAQGDLLVEMQPQLKESLHSAHDFLGLIKLVKSNVEAIFELRFPGRDPREAADALKHEGAIYFACEMMLARLDARQFLAYPQLARSGEVEFNVHPAVLKYIRIYESLGRQKQVKFGIGPSRGKVYYSSEAVGAIFQALLDNALKYAPARSSVGVSFLETESNIEVSVKSLGPRIGLGERDKIFLLGYRGQEAGRLAEGGMGFGLAAAMSVSRVLGLGLQVDQEDEESSRFPLYYPTTFSFTLRRVRE